VARLLAALLLLVAVAGAAMWFYQPQRLKPLLPDSILPASKETWLDRLGSQNLRVSAAAEAEVKQLGAGALTQVAAALNDPAAPPERRKAALRACALLGPSASPMLPQVAAHLKSPDYAAEAALALSVMGPEAFTPLADALTSPEPVVRKEALRSMGKLQQRAPLDVNHVIPPLLDALADRDPGVRTIAATYLGIIHQHGEEVVPALVEMLKDEHPEVRTAAATALGSFGAAASPALPALRKAVGDKDENVAREAGLSLVKLQSR
jgi:HEAT repeat protein